MFRVFETKEFEKRVSALSQSGHRSIKSKLEKQIYPHLKQTPHYGPQIKKLRNYQPETWRYRIGDYRLFYAIDDKLKIVRMLSLDHRKDSYR